MRYTREHVLGYLRGWIACCEHVLTLPEEIDEAVLIKHTMGGWIIETYFEDDGSLWVGLRLQHPDSKLEHVKLKESYKS
jgi:hypothetical protein